ncbi:hypothetical protein GCM10027586_06310 [Kineococcus gypseus]
MYCRISKDRAGGGLGVTRQEDDCRALAKRLGWEVVAVYVDNDLSAYSGKPRPGYRALLDDLQAGRANAVVVWHTDRLHRSPRELETFVDICEAHDVTTHTVTAGELDLSTPSGRLFARQLGSYARYEVEVGIERQRRAKEQRAAAGEWLGGPRPFGWQTDGTVVEEEARALQHWTTSILAGVSVASLTREANASGIKTTTGGRWSATELRRVVSRARNAGLVVHRGTILAGVSSGWPSIVPEDEWRAVSTLLLDPARRTNPSPSRRHLGSGLYLCGRCADGTTMTAGTATGGDLRYRCRAQHHLSRRMEPVDDIVLAVVEKRLREPDVSALLAKPASPAGEASTEAAALAARERMTHLAEEFGAGRLPLAAFTAGTALAQQVIDKHERHLAAQAAGTALAGIIDAGRPAQAFASLVAIARDEDRETAAASLDRLRAIIGTLVTVTILPQHRGRPSGWQAGQSVFDPSSVQIEWRQ